MQVHIRLVSRIAEIAMQHPIQQRDLYRRRHKRRNNKKAYHHPLSQHQLPLQLQLQRRVINHTS